jgi:hypothetical protein
MPPPAYPPPGPAGAQTIVAGQRPPGIPPGPPLPGVGPAAEAQTIIAPLDRNALAAAQARSSQGMPRQNMPPGYNPPGLPGMPPMPGAPPMPDDAGPGQTVVLPDSAGIPAFNRPTALAPVAQPLPAPPPPSRPVASYGSGAHDASQGQGSDTMFWILCIVGGMIVGVLAYVLALQIL